MKVPSPQFAIYKVARQIYETGDMAMDYHFSRMLASSKSKALGYIAKSIESGWLEMNGDKVSISPACRRYFDMIAEVQKPVGEIVQPRTVNVYNDKEYKCNLRREGVRDIYFMAGAR